MSRESVIIWMVGAVKWLRVPERHHIYTREQVREGGLWVGQRFGSFIEIKNRL